MEDKLLRDFLSLDKLDIPAAIDKHYHDQPEQNWSLVAGSWGELQSIESIGEFWRMMRSLLNLERFPVTNAASTGVTPTK